MSALFIVSMTRQLYQNVKNLFSRLKTRHRPANFTKNTRRLTTLTGTEQSCGTSSSKFRITNDRLEVMSLRMETQRFSRNRRFQVQQPEDVWIGEYQFACVLLSAWKKVKRYAHGLLYLCNAAALNRSVKMSSLWKDAQSTFSKRALRKHYKYNEWFIRRLYI